jgi:nucleoside-diphosphate-sugar epimerase
MDTKVFVTGDFDKVGVYVVPELAKAGYEVVIFDIVETGSD